MADQRYQVPAVDTDLDETLTLVKNGTTYLFSVAIDNEDSAEQYLVLFDAAATSDVTLGSTAAKYWVSVASGGLKDLQFDPPIRFRNGLVYSYVTQPDGSTGPTNHCHLAYGYR